MTETHLTPDERIKRFFSIKGVYVKSLTGKLISRLIESGYDDPAKILGLAESVFITFDGIPDTTVIRLIVDLEDARHTTLPRLLYALGFPGDDVLRYAMLRQHSTWYGLSWASCSPLRHIEGITDKNIGKIKAFFSDPIVNNLIVRLRDQGVYWDKMDFPPDGPLTNKRLVLTGGLQRFTRNEAEELILLHGGMVSDTVSSKTDYVLVGEKPGSKLTKARELGIETIDEATWLSWVGVNV